MSTTNTDLSTCANCGKGEEAAGDLKACTACKMVKYCNRECQIEHRPQHKKECKKRAAVLQDIKLFKQPLLEDCPICMIPLPSSVLTTGYRYYTCCGKFICSGCIHAVVHAVAIRDGGQGPCPFCRTPAATSEEEEFERNKKRAEVDDSFAVYNMGIYYNNGHLRLPRDRAKALELWHRAGKLGCASANYNLGTAYKNGNGVERDEKKAKKYLELGAMKRDAWSRHNLANLEFNAGNHSRALKHYMLSAGGGSQDALTKIQMMKMVGNASDDDYMKALKSYQSHLDEIKSPQRDEAAAFDEGYKYC